MNDCGARSAEQASRRKLLVSVAAMVIVTTSCMGGGAGDERTVLVDYNHDEVETAMFANFPKDLSVTPGTTIVFKQTWTGEPHTITGGTLIDDLLERFGPWFDFFEAYEALAASGTELPDPENPPDIPFSEFFEPARNAKDETAGQAFIDAYEAVTKVNKKLPTLKEAEDISMPDAIEIIDKYAEEPFEDETLPWAIDETKDGVAYVAQNSGQPCYLANGAPPKDADEPCGDDQQQQPEFDGTQTYYNSGIIPYEGAQGNTYRVKLAPDIEPGTYAFYCAVHGPSQRTDVKVEPEGTTVPSQEAVSRVARKEIAAFARPMLSVFEDASDGKLDDGPPVEGPFAGLSAPTHGTINAFVPKVIKTNVDEPVTWTLMGAEHTITFDVPEYFPIIRFAKDGKVSLNPKLQKPAGGSPKIGEADDGEILKVDGGTWDGSGFLSSGLFGGEPYAEYTLRFSKAGTYKYACLLHPPMVGTVEVS